LHMPMEWNNILYTASTPTCFNASALKHVTLTIYKILLIYIYIYVVYLLVCIINI
jgi:hypothetical protein